MHRPKILRFAFQVGLAMSVVICQSRVHADTPAEAPLNRSEAEILAQQHAELIAMRDAQLAWDTAAEFLRDGGARDEAAELFRDAADQPTVTKVSEDALALAKMLDAMAEEDRLFQEPADLDALTDSQYVDYLVYKLRDLSEEAISLPGSISFLSGYNEPNKVVTNLRQLGKAAIPRLIEMLDDERPTRSLEYPRNGGHLVRYADVALELIEAILAKHFSPQGAANSHDLALKLPKRKRVKSEIVYWWNAHSNESELDWHKAAIVPSTRPDGVSSETRLSVTRMIELDQNVALAYFEDLRRKDPDFVGIEGFIERARTYDPDEAIVSSTFLQE